VSPLTYSAISAAKQLGGDITALVCGPDCSKVATELAKAEGVGKLLVAQDSGFKGFLPEALSPLILNAQKQFGFTHIVGAASAMGKVRTNM
jgi:electron transfer flavoprotein alpha subunit